MRKSFLLLSTIAFVVSLPSAQAGQLTRVAGKCKGSNNATFYPSNRRVAVTRGGRWLSVYDVHGVGQQLVWRNPASNTWHTRTRGNVSNGFFPDGRLGDRPASIALAPDQRGRQHAWVVWSGYEYTKNPLPVKMRRLSGLDRPGGPRVSRPVKVARMGKGNARVDVAFERGRKGRFRGVISWLRKVRRHRYRLIARWFTQLGRNAPRFHHGRVLFTARRGSPTGTLVPSRRGMRLVVRTPSGKLQMFTHRSRAPLRKWTRAKSGIPVSAYARPSAVRLAQGRVVAAVESNPGRHVVKVVRFYSSRRRARVTLRLRGYEQPTLAGRNRRAWLVMIRRRDDNVVSRTFKLGSGWSRRDRVEIRSSGGGSYEWPNALRAPSRRLRFIVGGPGCPTSNAKSVLAYHRRI
jgi:hypothetical protein